MDTIHINGKTFNSWEEFMKDCTSNPNMLVWDYQDIQTVINGKPVYDGTSKGRCHYNGKTYEGVIEMRGNQLYVGGEFVREE